jgi:DNA-binding NarL/FixJ family response regulator
MEQTALHVEKMASPSTREQAVLQMVADGYSSTEIANQLYISVSVVKNIRLDWMKKTGTSNSPALVAHVIRKGIVR